mgnify:CR=1 FL=1
MEQRAHFYTPLTGVCALCEADSPDSQMSGLSCVALLRTRGCTPCDACAPIPADFAVETVGPVKIYAQNYLQAPAE